MSAEPIARRPGPDGFVNHVGHCSASTQWEEKDRGPCDCGDDSDRLAAAQAEVARLKDRVFGTLEDNAKCYAEIAVLRRVLADQLETSQDFIAQVATSAHLASRAEAVRALSAPSAAELLLADIRAAVEAERVLQEKLDSDLEEARQTVSARIAALRRWVP